MAAENENATDPNAWMVTFGDLIMLLLTFFVLLLTMKSMDKTQTEEMFENFINVEETEWDFGFQKADKKIAPETAGKWKTFISSSAMLKKTLKKDYYNFRRNFQISEDSRGIVVTIDSSHLFDSGSAEIRPAGFDKLNMVGEMLKNVTNDVLIMGHTDNVPIRRGMFRSNWDLSCYRAISVYQYLVEAFGLPEKAIAPGGYGSTRPLYPNTDEIGRAKNRRIEVILQT